jgi:glycosyltransferase involved in cell wall biosynthesis
VLYVTHGFPYPLTSGRLRHYHLLRELGGRHAIALVAAAGPEFQPEHAAAIEPFTRRLEVVVRPTSRQKLPPWSQMRASIERMLRRDVYDVVLSSMGSYPALAGLDLPPLVVDVCDANVLYQRGRIQHAPWWRRPRLWLRLRGLERLERCVVAAADRLTFISARDRDAVLGACAKPSTIVANGVDLDYWQRSAGQLDSRTIAFTGAMKYPPNEDAALLLVREIFPRVRCALPDAKLSIVGGSPTRRLLRAAAGRPGVTVTGFVPDVRPYLDEARVFVAPLRFGAGVQNKILEAMAMELPLITTPLAAAGLTTLDSQHAPLCIADDPREFADRICEELGREPRTVHAAGQQFVAEHFDWAKNARRMEAVLDSAVRHSTQADVAGRASS